MEKNTERRSFKHIITNTVKEYFTETTVHGFKYIVDGKNFCERGFWVILIISGFVISGTIILASLKAWNKTPLQTTIDKVSVPAQKFPFPAITLHDQDALQMSRRNRWMYIERLLNMIDVYGINKVNNKRIGSTTNATDFLNLRAIRLEVDNLLENHILERKW